MEREEGEIVDEDDAPLALRLLHQPPERYRLWAPVTFSQLQHALRMEYCPDYLERMLLDPQRPRVPPTDWGARLIRQGQRYELVLWEQLRRLFPQWNECGMRAQPTRLPEPFEQVVGCADYWLFDSLQQQLSVVELKVSSRHYDCYNAPLRYRLQLEAEMRSSGAKRAFLCVLTPTSAPERPWLLDDEENVTDLQLHDDCELRVWLVYPEENFWRNFVVPRLRLFLQWQRAAQEDAVGRWQHLPRAGSAWARTLGWQTVDQVVREAIGTLQASRDESYIFYRAHFSSASRCWTALPRQPSEAVARGCCRLAGPG